MKTKSWHRTLGAWVFIPVSILSYTLYTNFIWFVLSFLVYLCIAITVTVGYHRLFCHNAFVCSKVWHWIFGLFGAISLNSSPVSWSAVHRAHHRYSDTPMDPYESNLKYFLRFKERNNIVAGKNELKMMRDPMHKFLMNHSLSLFLVTGIMLFVIDINVFLYGFALPISTYLITSGLQTIYAHKNGVPQNLWYMEFIVPMAGEWIHKEHHQDIKKYVFNYQPHFFDLGGFLIRKIEHGKQRMSHQ